MTSLVLRSAFRLPGIYCIYLLGRPPLGCRFRSGLPGIALLDVAVLDVKARALTPRLAAAPLPAAGPWALARAPGKSCMEVNGCLICLFSV